MLRDLVLGIDVGGTNIKLGVTNAQGRIILRTNLVTRSYVRDRNRLIRALVKCVQALMAENGLSCRQFKGIGIGLPGLVDPVRGMVNFLPNIPGWRNVALKKILQQKLKIPVYLENDVNMITLGEWKFGAGKGYQNLICMTLGTGVGGGLILNNQLYRGEGFVAGELGHIPINEDGPACNCGGYACFERYVGNQQLFRRLEKIFGRKGMVTQDAFYLAIQGDQRAIKFWQETATHIGNALTGVVNVLNPPLIVIGGGVANNAKFLFPTIKKVIQKRAMKVQAAMVKIVRAKLGDDAGIIGARVLVKEKI